MFKLQSNVAQIHGPYVRCIRFFTSTNLSFPQQVYSQTYLCLSLNAHVWDRCHSSVPEGRGYCKIRFKPFRKQTRQTLLIELVYCCNVAGSLEVEQWEENQLSSVWGRTQTLTKSWSWWCVLSTFTAVNTAYHVRHFRDIQRFDEGHV